MGHRFAVFLSSVVDKGDTKKDLSLGHPKHGNGNKVLEPARFADQIALGVSRFEDRSLGESFFSTRGMSRASRNFKPRIE
jgi:hypothetical protein